MSDGPITTTTALVHTLRSQSDATAWNELVRRYDPLLRAVATRLGLGPEDAADMAQQALLEFVRDVRAGRFDRSRGRMRTWIAAIADHRCRDLLRRERVREAAIERAGPAGVDVETIWDEEEAAHVAVLAWQNLRASESSESRSIDVLNLVALRGMSPKAVAEELDMTIDAVYVARCRIAKRLRDEIERLSALYREDIV